MEENLKWSDQKATALAAMDHWKKLYVVSECVNGAAYVKKLQKFPQYTTSPLLVRLFCMGFQNENCSCFSLSVFRMSDFGLLEEMRITSFIFSKSRVSQKDLD